MITVIESTTAEHGEGSDVGASLNVPDLLSAAVQAHNDATLRQIIKTGKTTCPPLAVTLPILRSTVSWIVRSFAATSNQHAQSRPPRIRAVD
jgi:hypothetical protein